MKLRINEKETPNIEVKHEGVLEVPEGKNVDDLPLSHFVNLANKKGLSKITKALNNLQVWNKNDDPELSKWAGNMIDKLNRKLKKDEGIINRAYNLDNAESRRKEIADRFGDKFAPDDHFLICKDNELINVQVGKKYKCTACNGQRVEIVSIDNIVTDNRGDTASLTVSYRNKLYIVSSTQLYESVCSSSKGLEETTFKSNRFLFNELSKDVYIVSDYHTGKEFSVEKENGSWYLFSRYDYDGNGKRFRNKRELISFLTNLCDKLKTDDEDKYNSTIWGIFIGNDTKPHSTYKNKSDAQRMLNKLIAINDVDGHIDAVNESLTIKEHIFESGDFDRYKGEPITFNDNEWTDKDSRKLEEFICQKLDENSLWVSDVAVDKAGSKVYINIEIEDGDWKHEHKRLDYEMFDIIYEYNPELVSNYYKDKEEVTDEDGSDTYSAIHKYVIELQ